MVETSDTPEPVLALVRDLMFQSRITAAGKRAGVAVNVIRDPAALAGAAGRLVIADLDQAGALEAAAAWAKARGRPAAGFVQHVNVEVIRAAQAAGFAPVVTRSRFDAVLPRLLGLDEPPQ